MANWISSETSESGYSKGNQQGTLLDNTAKSLYKVVSDIMGTNSFVEDMTASTSKGC